jgi:hypothetical protein
MLTALLDGAVSTAARAAEILRVLDLATHDSYLVVRVADRSAGWVPDGAAGDPLHALEERLRGQGIGSAWIHQGGGHTALLGLPPGRDVAGVHRVLTPTSPGRVGVSRAFTSPLDAARARREAELAELAELAERCIPPGSAGTHVYGDSLVALMIVTAPEMAEELARTVLGPLLELPAIERSLLLAGILD